jgi:hypothetical protein
MQMYVRTVPAIVFSIVSKSYNAASVRPSKNRSMACNLDARAGTAGERTVNLCLVPLRIPEMPIW